jgi:putative hydrolase
MSGLLYPETKTSHAVSHDVGRQDPLYTLPVEHDTTDVNLEVGALLLDIAAVQENRGSAMGYQRAASAILSLDRQIIDLEGEEDMASIAGVGPATLRIIIEYLETGTSAFVEAAIPRSSKGQKEVDKQRNLRTNFLSRARVASIMAADEGVGPSDYRGDFQLHSEWSDGSETLENVVAGCMARSYTCAAITDHSYGLSIAHGMTMEEVALQHVEIDRINAALDGRFRLFKGIEANLRNDGTVDMEPEELRTLDLVVASPHSLLRRPDDQTARMLTAVRQPNVHILGHPRGRKYSNRPGVTADWDAVFEAAAETEVAIEIDGSWNRQDVDWELAARALGRGCIFALDSDAHYPSELQDAVVAMAHARLAGIPRERIVNCWSDDEIIAWSERRKG